MERGLAEAVGDLVPVTLEGRLAEAGPLLFDHDQIVPAVVEGLRARYKIEHVPQETYAHPDGFRPAPFTLHQLRKVH